MGTHAITVIHDDEDILMGLFRTMDGYPDSHGQELADFLNGYTIVNGLGANGPEKIANGMGCLAAQLVAHFKTEPGSFYMMPVTVEDEGQETYEYHIYGGLTQQGQPLPVKIKVLNYTKILYEGDVAGFVTFCAKAC